MSRRVGILAKHKQKLKKTPSKNGGHSPLRITFKNQEKQAECAPPLPPPLHTPRGDTESTHHADDYEGNTSRKMQAFLKKNKICQIKKIRQSACSHRKMRLPPLLIEDKCTHVFSNRGAFL